MQKVFIIEDEIQIIELIKSYLEKDGFLVDYATSGLKGLREALVFQPDILILDLMLPDMTGEEVLREIRKKSNMHILILSAKINEESVINGFEIGADDYIRKPFSPRELTSKINAIVKKNKKNIVINNDLREIEFNGQKVKLTKNEYNIFCLFINNPNQVFTRENIIDILFTNYEAYDRTIDAYIKNIRKKTNIGAIKTVHGVGYKMGDINEI